MKLKQFRSILAVATVATSITACSLPSQAFTWDDLWGAVKKGVEKAYQEPSNNSSNNLESASSSPESSELSDNSNSSSNNSESLGNNNIKPAPVKRRVSLIRQDDFTFQPVGCKKQSGDFAGIAFLKCSFKITYVGNDEVKNFAITNARVFSAIDGNQYTASSLTVAGQYSVDMIKGQPIQGVLSFEWSPALKRLSVMEFETNSTSHKISIR
jgi:hypothetical protein